MQSIKGVTCLLLFPGSNETVPTLTQLHTSLKSSGVTVKIWRVTEISQAHLYEVKPNVIRPSEYALPSDEASGPLLKLIEQADFIIADITGNSPNVIYGIGLADASRKPVLLIVQENSQPIPTTFSGEIFLSYQPTRLNKLTDYVKAWARHHQRAVAA